MRWIISLVVIVAFTLLSAAIGHINIWLALGILAAGGIGTSLIEFFVGDNAIVWFIDLFRSTEAKIQGLEARIAALRAK